MDNTAEIDNDLDFELLGFMPYYSIKFICQPITYRIWLAAY